MTSQEVTDLDRGLKELALALDEQADSLPIIRNFKAWLGVRRGARGTVNPVITPEFYVLTCELIYDRIVNQYDSKSTVSVIMASGKRSVATEQQGVFLTELRSGLTSVFQITKANRLAFRTSENMLAVASARANMAARIDPPFELRFSEDEGADELLRTPDSKLSRRSKTGKTQRF
jgi:hypothetical protein